MDTRFIKYYANPMARCLHLDITTRPDFLLRVRPYVRDSDRLEVYSSVQKSDLEDVMVLVHHSRPSDVRMTVGTVLGQLTDTDWQHPQFLVSDNDSVSSLCSLHPRAKYLSYTDYFKMEDMSSVPSQYRLATPPVPGSVQVLRPTYAPTPDDLKEMEHIIKMLKDGKKVDAVVGVGMWSGVPVCGMAAWLAYQFLQLPKYPVAKALRR